MNEEMRRAILEAYVAYAEHNLPATTPDNYPVPILVRFRLGDLRKLKRESVGPDRD